MLLELPRGTSGLPKVRYTPSLHGLWRGQQKIVIVLLVHRGLLELLQSSVLGTCVLMAIFLRANLSLSCGTSFRRTILSRRTFL